MKTSKEMLLELLEDILNLGAFVINVDDDVQYYSSITEDDVDAVVSKYTVILSDDNFSNFSLQLLVWLSVTNRRDLFKTLYGLYVLKYGDTFLPVNIPILIDVLKSVDVEFCMNEPVGGVEWSRFKRHLQKTVGIDDDDVTDVFKVSNIEYVSIYETPKTILRWFKTHKTLSKLK